MKKVLILLLVVIIGVAIIGPKIVGSQLESGIQNTVNNINKNSNYTASITSIQTSWFTTNADISVGILMPDMSKGTGEESLGLSVDLLLTAQHGPIITKGGFALAWLKSHIVTKNSELPEGLVLKAARPLYEFDGLTGLFGSTDYKDSVAAIDYTDGDNEGTVSFSGMQGEGTFSSGGLKYVANTEHVAMGMPSFMSVDIEKLSMSIDSADSLHTMMTQGLYNARSSMSMNILTWNDMVEGTEGRIVDTQLLATSDYNKATDLGGFEVKTTVASADASNISITDLNAVIEIKNLQAKFLLAYQDFTNQMLNNANDANRVGEDLKAFIDTHLLKQLQANPEYNISQLSGKINGSEFDGKLLAKLANVTALPDTLEDPSFWMQHAVVDSKIVMQKSAAEFFVSQFLASQMAANPQFASMNPEQQAQIIEQQIESTLSAFVQQGMVKMNGEDYEFSFNLQAGKSTLNGNNIPL